MKNLYLVLVLFLQFQVISVAQSDTLGAAHENDTITNLNKLSVKPLVSLGSGVAVYYGDLHRFNGTSPIIGHWGFNIGFGARLTRYLDVQFSATSSSLSYHENTKEVSRNFKTSIFSSGVTFTYNFNNFFKEDPVINPLFMVGLNSLEFNSKTDLDNNYHYETDLRGLNLDGLGMYSLQTLSLPIGIGAEIDLASGFSLRLTSTMNFTFTDNIDNVSEAGEGVRKGDSKNDKYLYTGLSLFYTIKTNNGEFKDNNGELYFGDTDDEDGDIVFDIDDMCPHTPEGVEVDDFGCPLDRDEDGVADYLDEEIDSPVESIVNAKGVALYDDDFYEMYLTYLDSLGNHTNTIKTVYTSNEGGRVIVHTPRYAEESFMVKIDASNDSLSTEQIGKILSIPDVKIVFESEATYYYIGEFDKLELAVEEKIILEKEGIVGEVVGIEKGEPVVVGQIAMEIEEDYKSGEMELSDRTAYGEDVIYRVQIGAFLHPLSMNIFEGVNDLIVLKGNDGLTRYLTGSYESIQKAAGRKIEVLLDGFEGAFLVAYNDGKRISLEDAGNVTNSVERVANDKVNKSKIRFKVQIGAYKDKIPVNVMDKFISIGDVNTIRQNEITMYLTGDFETYNQAKILQKELKANGFKDAFIVGTFNNKIISVKEANEMLEK